MVTPTHSHPGGAPLTLSSAGLPDLPRLRPPVRSLWDTCGGLRLALTLIPAAKLPPPALPPRFFMKARDRGGGGSEGHSY